MTPKKKKQPAQIKSVGKSAYLRKTVELKAFPKDTKVFVATAWQYDTEWKHFTLAVALKATEALDEAERIMNASAGKWHHLEVKKMPLLGTGELAMIGIDNVG